jgi:tetratricopeptide (TPR) repeat protein
MPVTVGAWRRRALLALAVAFSGGVYLNALHNPFVYDDHRTIVDNGSIHSLSDMRSIVLHDATRPLVNLSYAIDRTVWGPAPIGFHVTSIVLHMLNVALLVAIAWRLGEDRARISDVRLQTSDSCGAAFLAATLFAVHPLMTEAVAYISGRSEVLCGTFFLLAFLAARRWMRTGAAGWWLLTMGLWVGALLTKEIAVMLPVVLLSYDRMLADEDAIPRRRRFWRLHAPLLAATVAAGVARLAVFVVLERHGAVAIDWRGIFDEAGVIWRYIALFFVPSGQTIFHDVRPIARVLELRGLVAAGAIAIVASVAWRARRAAPIASFGVIWFFLLLIPSSLIVVLDQGEGMAEHRVYLASCGLFLAAGSVGGAWLERLGRASVLLRSLTRAAVAVAILSLGARTVLRNAVWSDPVGLWREAADRAPESVLPRTVLGETLHDAGRHAEAVEAYRTALRLRPDEPLGYLKLGICLAETGRLDEARETFEQLRARQPTSTIVSTGLGAVAMIAGQPDTARPYFEATLARDPRDVMARQWLAVLEEEAAGNPHAALRRCEEIQELAPGKLSNEDCIRRNKARVAAVGAAAQQR